MAFDTLAYMKRLEAGGIDRAQAEAHAEAINDYLRPDLATKDDIAALRGEMELLRGEMQSEMRLLRAEVHADMAGLEQRMVGAISTLRQDIATREARLIGVIAAMLGVLFGLIALLRLLS
jgi:hypothetical protein